MKKTKLTKEEIKLYIVGHGKGFSLHLPRCMEGMWLSINPSKITRMYQMFHPMHRREVTRIWITEKDRDGDPMHYNIDLLLYKVKSLIRCIKRRKASK